MNGSSKQSDICGYGNKEFVFSDWSEWAIRERMAVSIRSAVDQPVAAYPPRDAGRVPLVQGFSDGRLNVPSVPGVCESGLRADVPRPVVSVIHEE